MGGFNMLQINDRAAKLADQILRLFETDKIKPSTALMAQALVLAAIIKATIPPHLCDHNTTVQVFSQLILEILSDMERQDAPRSSLS